MEATEKRIRLFQKIQYLQLQLKSPKDSRNQHGGYMYRTASGILEAAKPICSRIGLMITLRDEIETHSNALYVKSFAGLVDIESGESFETTALAREDIDRKGMCNSQMTGSASSYARKYALSALLAIDDSRADPDTTENAQAYAQQQAQAYAQAQQGGYGYAR